MSNEYNRDFIKNDLVRIIINHVNKKITEKADAKVDSIRKLSIPKDEENRLIQKITKKLLLPKVSDFLDKDDIVHMAKMAGKKHTWKKSAFNNIAKLKRKSDNGIRLSYPIFSKKGDISAYFAESSSSLSMIFCKKNESDKWELYCSGTIWIE